MRSGVRRGIRREVRAFDAVGDAERKRGVPTAAASIPPGKLLRALCGRVCIVCLRVRASARPVSERRDAYGRGTAPYGLAPRRSNTGTVGSSLHKGRTVEMPHAQIVTAHFLSMLLFVFLWKALASYLSTKNRKGGACYVSLQSTERCQVIICTYSSSPRCDEQLH